MKAIAQSIAEFKQHWRNYILQSVAAMLTFAVILVCQPNVIVIASMAATTFIIFAMPTIITAQPRNVIGGQFVGLLCGSVCSFIPHEAIWMKVLVYSFVVGITMFVMVITDTEHPPAAATALGFASKGYSFETAYILMGSVLILSLIHRLLKRHLRDLT